MFLALFDKKSHNKLSALHHIGAKAGGKPLYLLWSQILVFRESSQWRESLANHMYFFLD